MTAEELTHARAALGFPSASAFATWLGVSRNSACRWEAGSQPVPPMTVRIIQLLQERATWATNIADAN
jgi:DNA-binding transcriptional regulator YiaG